MRSYEEYRVHLEDEVLRGLVLAPTPNGPTPYPSTANREDPAGDIDLVTRRYGYRYAPVFTSASICTGLRIRTCRNVLHNWERWYIKHGHKAHAESAKLPLNKSRRL